MAKEADLTIVGARRLRGPLKPLLEAVKDMAGQEGVEIQLLRAAMVFGRDHLLSAVEHARRAFERGTNTAESLAVEVLLYASGRRQISEALALMGLREDTEELAVVALSATALAPFLHALGLARDDSVLQGRKEALSEYGIGEEEMASVTPDRVFDLVLERVALVDLLK